MNMSVDLSKCDRVYHKTLSMKDYMEIEGLSSSELFEFSKSPKHYKAMKKQDDEQSRSLLLGTALHCALEDYEVFNNSYVAQPSDIDRRTKAGKEAYQLFVTENEGKTVLSSFDYHVVNKMYYSVINSDDTLVMELFNCQHDSEISILWTEHGILQKCRPDRLITLSDDARSIIRDRFNICLPEGATAVLDYKTTSKGASPRSFIGSCKTFGYFLKAAHYLEGTQSDIFFWLAIESEPPFCVELYAMNEDSGAKYFKLRRTLLGELKTCMREDYWPSYRINDSDRLLGSE